MDPTKRLGNVVALVLLLAFAWAETAAGQTTTVNFDTPAPPGSSLDLVNGVFQGIDFGNGQGRWDSAYDVDPTNHIFFDAPAGTPRTLGFSPAPPIPPRTRVFPPDSTARRATLPPPADLRQTST